MFKDFNLKTIFLILLGSNHLSDFLLLVLSIGLNNPSVRDFVRTWADMQASLGNGSVDKHLIILSFVELLICEHSASPNRTAVELRKFFKTVSMLLVLRMGSLV